MSTVIGMRVAGTSIAAVLDMSTISRPPPASVNETWPPGTSTPLAVMLLAPMRKARFGSRSL